MNKQDKQNSNPVRTNKYKSSSLLNYILNKIYTMTHRRITTSITTTSGR